SLRASDATGGGNDSGFMRAGEWISWNIVVPSTGDYHVTAATTPGGRAEILVDGDPVTDGTSASSLGEGVRLTKGIHAIRVQSAGGEFVAQSITVVRTGGPTQSPPPAPTPNPQPTPPPTPNPTPTPAPSPSSGLPSGWRNEDVGTPAVRGRTTVRNGQWT